MQASNILSLTIRDAHSLVHNYLPFVENGGIYVPTGNERPLGTKVLLLMHMKMIDRGYAVEGRVIWITPANAGLGRRVGIGLQFVNPGEKLVTAVQLLLDQVSTTDDALPGATL